MAVHVRGAFFATQAVLPAMKAKHYGRIVNISSQWGLAGSPMLPITRAQSSADRLHERMGEGIRAFRHNVNSVAPGYIKTPMTIHSQRSPEVYAERIKPIPLGRGGEPIDISYAVAWLASDEAAFVTGHVLNASGGEVI